MSNFDPNHTDPLFDPSETDRAEETDKNEATDINAPAEEQAPTQTQPQSNQVNPYSNPYQDLYGNQNQNPYSAP